MSKKSSDASSKSESPDKGPDGGGSITNEERDMANKATELFEVGNYDACGKILKQLNDKRGPDPRVLLNIAVINYYKSGQTKTEEFKKALFEASSKASVNVENIAALDDVDQCVFYYNHAVLLFHLRQYKTALALMDKLYTFVEPMEESLSRRVLFLLIELYLCTSQPEKALAMLIALEKSLFNGKSDQAKDGKESEKESKKDSKEKDSANDAQTEQWKSRISQTRARCYMMMRSMKLYKREVKTVIGLAPNATPTCYLKSNYECTRGNTRKAIKLLNSAPQPGKSTAETGECLPMMHFNNMAVIHFVMHKPNLSVFYLQKAAEENEKAARQFNKPEHAKTLSGRPLHTIAVSRHYELIYNMGISLLHSGKPEAALDCLNQVINVYRINPRLWLRVAECCIMIYKKDNDEDTELSKRMQVIQSSVGSGVHRKLVLGSGLKKERVPPESMNKVQPSLEFASMCLKNALILLPEDPLDVVPPTGDDQEQRATPEALPLAPPGCPLKQHEVQNLRTSILLSSAYVCLCLNDFVLARQFAGKLLKQPRLSGVHIYLGRMYLAEAMVGVDRIADAITNLNPDAITDISLIQPENRGDYDKNDKNDDNGDTKTHANSGSIMPWSPRDLGKAKAIMQYNLAAAHAVRGEFEKALMHLNQCKQSLGSPLPAQAYFLNIYLELMEGRRKVAHSIIKDNFGHVTPN